jgi:rSAM/selenodomain-associated transferase 1
MDCVIVLAKAPRPGEVKTRLATEPTIGPEGAARLAEAFLRDTLAACAAVRGAETVVCFAPNSSEREFRALAPRVRLVAQVEGDLGARLAAAFADAFERGAARAVAVGTDAPPVGAERLERALAMLAEADVVLGPAEDGGYDLIALRRRAPGLFHGIAWSTTAVFEQTLARARVQGLSVATLESTFDVDRLEDLERLRQLTVSGETHCPHTERVLADLARDGRAR